MSCGPVVDIPYVECTASIPAQASYLYDYAGGKGGMHGVICMHQRISGMGAVPLVGHHSSIEHHDWGPYIVHDVWYRSGLWTLPKA
jgi:hypothetical protein